MRSSASSSVSSARSVPTAPCTPELASALPRHETIAEPDDPLDLKPSGVPRRERIAEIRPGRRSHRRGGSGDESEDESEGESEGEGEGEGEPEESGPDPVGGGARGRRGAGPGRAARRRDEEGCPRVTESFFSRPPLLDKAPRGPETQRGLIPNGGGSGSGGGGGGTPSTLPQRGVTAVQLGQKAPTGEPAAPKPPQQSRSAIMSLLDNVVDTSDSKSDDLDALLYGSSPTQSKEKEQ